MSQLDASDLATERLIDWLQTERLAVSELAGAAVAYGAATDQSYEATARRIATSPAAGRHIARMRTQAERLRRRLPFEGLPCASGTLHSGCDLVAADDAAATGVADLLLEAYGIMLERRASYISQRN